MTTEPILLSIFFPLCSGRAFQGVHAKTLGLHYNDIQSLDANAFLGVGSFLDTLYLHSNALQSLADDAFKGEDSPTGDGKRGRENGEEFRRG